MALIENREYKDTRVDLDGNEFRGCRFENCRLIYSGGELPGLVRNSIIGCEFNFDGAARRTLRYLSNLRNSGDDALRTLVDDIIEQIMRGGPAPKA